MNMIRYQPLSVMGRLHRDLDDLFSNRFSENSKEPASVADWVPAVDIKEDEKQFNLWVDLPGVKVEDVEVSMENGTLSIQGKREHESLEERDGFRRVERTSGRFLRRFTLPDSVDETGIKARNRDGVLEIVIPKQAKQLAKTIQIDTA